MKIEVVSLSLILFAYHIFYDDHQLFYIDGSNGFGDDEDLESESSTIPYVENDIDIDDEYFHSEDQHFQVSETKIELGKRINILFHKYYKQYKTTILIRIWSEQ